MWSVFEFSEVNSLSIFRLTVPNLQQKFFDKLKQTQIKL